MLLLLLLFVLMMLGRTSAGSRGPFTDGLAILKTKLTLGDFRLGVCKIRSRRRRRQRWIRNRMMERRSSLVVVVVVVVVVMVRIVARK